MPSGDPSIRPGSRPRPPGIGLLTFVALCLLLATSGQSPTSHLEQIAARGSLVMLTVNGATTYFQGAESETGFEYELARRFADYVDLPLEVVVLPTIGEALEAARRRQGDFVAANLTPTDKRARELRFGPAYEEVAPTVVYRRGSRRPREIADLAEGRLTLLADTSYEPILAEANGEIDWQTAEGASIEDLLEAISQEEIDYTIVDSNILALNRRFFPAVRPAFEIGPAQPLAWATARSDDDTLVQEMRAFFALAEESDTLAELRQRHYDYVEAYEPVGTFTFMRQLRNRLPPLQPLFQQAAETTGLDWRLLAAVGYQESHWDPDAVSFTGVRGVMMLTQRTAGQLGIADRSDPAQSIIGGAHYLKSMIERIPDRIQSPDRIWMGLAAYNIGFGHLEDARILTERLGGDPDRWVDVRDHLPLLTQERWYSQTRFGYARGYEPVRYVENIRTFHDILVWMDNREDPMLAGR